MSHGAAAAPAISVIVPVYDVAAQVGAAIASLRAQTFPDFEAIIVDDGSTDGSGAIAARAFAGDPRFTLLVQENRGLSGARNAGLERARGTFVAFLDSDDRFDARFLEGLHDALRADGGDWAACAIRLCYPDGMETAHAAIHGAPEPRGVTRRIGLQDAREVASHFPSAWNKLYRRAFIGDLRFDEGTWYEDHTFFWQLAARGGHLLYLPQPLYLHSRDRPGQITTADDPRVFEQFDVLERVAGMILHSDMQHRHEGLARLATRLLHERALVVREPARRAAFLEAARGFLSRHALPFSAEWDREISRGLGLVLQGARPLSVVLLAEPGTQGAMRATLDAMEAQSLPDFEVLLAGEAPGLAPLLANGAPLHVLGPSPRLGSALTAAARAATGRYVVFLRPGDLPAPSAFMVWVSGMERASAAQACDLLGVSGFESGTWRGGHFQPGLHDRRAFGQAAEAVPPAGAALPLEPHGALSLHGEPGALVFSRGFLQREAVPLAAVLDAAPAALCGAALALMAGLHTQRIVWFPFPAIALPPRALPAPHRLGGAVRDLRDALASAAPMPAATLPAGWERVLHARLAQRHAQAARGRLRRLWRGAQAAALMRAAGAVPRADMADQDLAPWLRRLLGLPVR
ncbi:MAG: glycosyltransferase [Pararhodobacter sp.]